MNNLLFDLNGKNALITGSAQGLGLVLARGLGKAGANIIVNARTQEKIDVAVNLLKQEGITAYSSRFDVTCKEQISDAIKDIEDNIGSIDILVNNAGIQRRAPLEDFSESDWHDILETNLTGVFLTTQQVVKRMIVRRAGKIINICSMQSELGRQNITPYAASKGGLKMMTKGMAVEWAKYNIQINGIGPGYFITEMTQPLADDPKFNSWICSRTPANRWGDPEELIGAAVFLASEASNFVNGQIIYVDGGILAAI
jgi:gluconate 5-dehydrogenase